MIHTITLIPGSPIMPPQLFDQVLLNVDERGFVVEAIDWLEPRRVVDIHISGDMPSDFASGLRDFTAAFMTDVIVQPLASRDKKMLISDMDSTMITIECIDELADYVGKKDHVAQITERAMNGELDFEAALNERVALLVGLPEQSLQACFDERVRYMPGAAELVAVMKAQGVFCLLVSGGFDFFTARVAGALGFDADVSNKLEIADGKLTGKVIPPIMDKDGKVVALNKYASERGINMEEVLAVGDGANDLPMLKTAGFGVAYHAKPSVRAEANHVVEYNDLTALIYAQGFEFKPE